MATKKTATKKTATKKTATKKTATKKTATKKTATKKTATTKEAQAFSPRTIKAFYNRIKEGDLEEVAADIARGMPLDDLFDAHGWGAEGVTPLSHALEAKQYAVAKLLLEAGARVDIKGEYGYAPLHQPCSPELTDLLVARGASLDARDNGGSTPLHRAAGRKDVDAARALLAHGAAIDAEDHEGKTPWESTFDVRMRDFLVSQGSVGLRKTGGHPLTPTSVESAQLSDIDVSRGCLGVDRRGNIWFAGYAGLFRSDGAKLTRHRFAESIAYGGFARGKGDAVFFATSGGLLETDVDATHFRMHDATDSGLHDNHITLIAASPAGDIYLGCYESEFDEGKHLSVYDGESWRLLRPGVELPVAQRIEHLAVDEQGALLLSLRKGFAEQRDGAWHVETEFGRDDVFAPTVYEILIDGRTVYFGTQQGVFCRRKGEYKLWETQSLAKHLCLHGETLWIGTYFGGLLRLELPTGELTTYKTDSSELPNDDIEGLHPAPDGTIWVHAGSHVARIRDGAIEAITRR